LRDIEVGALVLHARMHQTGYSMAVPGAKSAGLAELGAYRDPLQMRVLALGLFVVDRQPIGLDRLVIVMQLHRRSPPQFSLAMRA
jgi:hypothetical protein